MATPDQRMEAKKIWLECKTQYRQCINCGKEWVTSRFAPGWYVCPICRKEGRK